MSDTFEVVLTREDGYTFDVDFRDQGEATLRVDEPEPLGEGRGPNAARLLAGAVGDCLSASLLFCLEKARVDVSDVRTRVRGSIVRNEEGRLRLGPLKVSIEPTLGTGTPARLNRCLEIFEDFCVVTESVRAGLQVDVEVATPAVADEGVRSKPTS